MQLMSTKQVAYQTRLSRATIYSLMDESKPAYDASFPKPIHIGKSLRWVQEEILAWLGSLKRGTVVQPVHLVAKGKVKKLSKLV